MPTSQDMSQGRRAAHFSQGSEEQGETTTRKARRTATPRSDTSRRSSTQSTRTASAEGGPARRAASQQAAAQPVTARGMRSSGQMSERTARATKRAAAARARRSKATQKQQASRRRRGLPLVTILAVVAVAAVVGIGFLVVPHLFQRTETVQEQYPSGEQVIVTVPDGAGGAQIAQLLIDAHVLSDENVFYQEVSKQNADSTMKSGTYQFITGATVSEVVKQLVSGPNATEFQLKLAEGLTVEQTAAQVESQLGVPADEFHEQAKASNYVDEYEFLDNVSDDSLEGYLFAKTYDFGGKEMNADTVIRTLLDQYRTEVASLDFATAREAIQNRYDITISDYGIIKLASIIEREALTDEERPLVASVFYNRLGRPFPGMGYVWPYLQSDATMMYVVDGEVTQADNQSDSPYSTYTNPNLPPTPICSPSLPSIEAALDPAETDYFFFYIKPDYSAFSETAAEHEQAQADYVNSQSSESDG